MPAIETTLRDEMAAVVKAAAVDLVVKTYDELPSAEELPPGETRVYCYPGPRSVVKADRDGRELRIVCYAYLTERLSPDATRDDRTDELMSLADTLEKSFTEMDAFVEYENGDIGRPPYDLDRLREQQVFATTLQPVFIAFAE
jgi:hypothetical protein